jgi:hypothetical protein
MNIMVCLWFIIQQFTLQLRERQIILGFFFWSLNKTNKNKRAIWFDVGQYNKL